MIMGAWQQLYIHLIKFWRLLQSIQIPAVNRTNNLRHCKYLYSLHNQSLKKILYIKGGIVLWYSPRPSWALDCNVFFSLVVPGMRTHLSFQSRASCWWREGGLEGGQQRLQPQAKIQWPQKYLETEIYKENISINGINYLEKDTLNDTLALC